MPELVFIEINLALGRNEPDAEIRQLLKASTGLNLALDYLPGSMMFDAAAGNTASSEIASMAVWFDAFVQNVDRTPRNPNLLLWHNRLWFIDHGAALFFHHNWTTAEQKAGSSFAESLHHVLLPWATEIEGAARIARQTITPELLHQILSLVPDAWLESPETTGDQSRAAYLTYLTRRLQAAANFEEEAIRAHHRLL